MIPTRVPFCAETPKGDFLAFRKKDFSGFFPKPFPGAMTITATSGISINVKALPFKKTF